MRHRVSSSNLNRKLGHLVAMRRNLASALFQHGQIRTTLPKAKHVQRFVERLITIARKGTLQARREVIARLQDRALVKGHDPDDDPEVKLNNQGRVVDSPRLVRRLFDEIAPRYVDRPGGYTRIVHTSKRRIGDGAKLVVLQLVGPDEPEKKKPTNVSPRRRRARARYALAERGGKKTAAVAEPEEAEAESEAPQEVADDDTEGLSDEAVAEAEAAEEAAETEAEAAEEGSQAADEEQEKKE